MFYQLIHQVNDVSLICLVVKRQLSFPNDLAVTVGIGIAFGAENHNDSILVKANILCDFLTFRMICQ